MSGVRLSDEVCALRACKLDRRDERARRGDYSLLGRTRHIAVCADQTRAVLHESDRVKYVLVVVVHGFADDHIIGIHVVHGDADIIECLYKSGRADNVRRASGRLLRHEFRGGERRCIEMLLAHGQSHALKLLLKLERRAARMSS